jgi:hypothetical protein
VCVCVVVWYGVSCWVNLLVIVAGWVIVCVCVCVVLL